MEQTQTLSPDIKGLETLLLDASRDPMQLVRELRTAREACTDSGAVARDLNRTELHFLSREASKPGPESFVTEVDRARRAALILERRSLELASIDDPAVLFDIAELRAECQILEMADELENTARMLEERLQQIPVGDSLLEEARERWAALSTEEEDLPLQQKVLLLQETEQVVMALAARTGDRQLRRLGRRLGRAANDRILVVRLERALTRRGVKLLETASFVGLLVVLVLLMFGLVVGFDTSTDPFWFQVEGFICLFFILEFLFKLALAPERISWFLRNAVTDLLPAVPAVIFLGSPTAAGEAAGYGGLRALRLIKISLAARYVQALRPLLRLFSLLLFLVRGMDGVVRRFSSLLNRNFIFFEKGVEPLEDATGTGERTLLFRALRREHVLLTDLPPEQRLPQLAERAATLTTRLAGAEPVAAAQSAHGLTSRDIPVEHAIESLYTMRPEDVGLFISHKDLAALDRVVKVLNAPLIRSLPLLRRLRIKPMPETPEERVAALGRRIAAWLESWHNRLLFVADLHGIVTGPQILDRVATTMVRTSQRPAVRLLLFGSLFFLLSTVLREDSAIRSFLYQFVAGPLVILGSFCLVLLLLGRWLRSIAGEASETFKLTSEAHFIGLLHLVKRRHEERDLQFLARRIFRWEMKPEQAVGILTREVGQIRRGTGGEGETPPPELREDLNRVALLYLHFLDGALLHESDIKSTEQLLANLSLENIRYAHLGFTRKDRKRLKRLSLAEGSLFTGPYLWFRFITQSVAVEAAKRITEYNRQCLTLEQQRTASSAQRDAMARWMKNRLAGGGGRMVERTAPPGTGATYQTTEFNALDFLSVDPERDAHILRIFGAEVLDLLRRDRQGMIREIFGTRPLDQLPRSRRSFNFYLLYNARLSKGRIFLLPVYLFLLSCRLTRMFASRLASIVREIMAPHRAQARRGSGKAPFAAALRKIHRMKAPGLLEAMRTRVKFDPAYCGIPPTWSDGALFEVRPELEQDMDFLHLKERERREFREVAEANRRRVLEMRSLMHRLPALPEEEETEMGRRLGERAVTIAYMTDREGLRTLFRAEIWFEELLPVVESPTKRIPGTPLRRLGAAILRGFRRHPVDRWLRSRVAQRRVSWRGRRQLKRAYHRNLLHVRDLVNAWLRVPPDRSPSEFALEMARRIYTSRGIVSREVAALRAVQSLSVLDVRNYRDLVFRLGGYGEEGEVPGLATELP